MWAFLSTKADDERTYHARPLIFAFGLCAGSALYFAVLFEPEPISVLFGWLLALGALQLSLMRLEALGVLAAIIVFSIVSGFGLAKVRTHMVASEPVSLDLAPVMVEGWIVGIEPGSNGVRVRILTHAVEGKNDDKRPREIRLTHRSSLSVSAGRFVRCLAVLRSPPGPSIPGDYDFRRQSWFAGLDAVGYVQGRCRGGAVGHSNNPGVATRAYIASLRRDLAEFTRISAGKRAGGFAAALTSGDRSFMAQADRDVLRAAGLAHLLAISGLHIGIVCGLVHLIFFKGLARISWLAILQKPAAVAALIAGGSYLVISGASVSTQRAFIMAALVFTAVLIDRNAISLRTFALAMIAVIVISPVSVLTPGFQMSFAATGVLIAVYEVWRERRMSLPQGFGSGPAFAFKSLIVTSIAAGLATAPFAFYHFDRIAPYGLLANVLAMPIISFVTAPAAALSMTLAPFGLAEHGLRLFGWSLELVLAIAHWTAGSTVSSGPQWKPMPDTSLFLFSIAIGCFILLTGKTRRNITGVACAFALLNWWMSIPASVLWAPSGDVYARIEGRYTLISFVDGEGLAPLRYKGLTVSGYCKNRICPIETDSGLVVLFGDDNLEQCDRAQARKARLVLSLRNKPEKCGEVISFSQIKNNGGASIWLKESAVKIRFAKKCGSRPWMLVCDD